VSGDGVMYPHEGYGKERKKKSKGAGRREEERYRSGTLCNSGWRSSGSRKRRERDAGESKPLKKTVDSSSERKKTNQKGRDRAASRKVRNEAKSRETPAEKKTLSS